MAIGVYIMQYTGLTDKNGKETYEGDILIEQEGDPYVVTYGNWDSDVESVYGYRFAWFSEPDTREVIGNIHENPELLNAI